MLISEEKRFIFIHIPKTAGMSVNRALIGVAPDSIRRIEDLPAFNDPQKHRHLFARDLLEYFGPKLWRGYFSFAMVRNPFSRLVSWYNMCHERPTNKFMWRVKRDASTFSEFLRMSDRIVARTRFNQVDYVTDVSGKPIVNFVGYFENLEHDFQAICDRIGVESRLPHLNATAKVDYREFYDAASRNLVESRFSRDLEAFGYSFTSAAPVNPPRL
jgi:chondroitin 4-sulfotransferase 11